MFRGSSRENHELSCYRLNAEQAQGTAGMERHGDKVWGQTANYRAQDGHYESPCVGGTCFLL